VVIAWVIRNFGAVVAGDLLSVGDGGGVGNDWTPLHAAAHAIARRARESAALESQLARALAIIEMVTRGASRSVCADVIATADEVIGMLAISGDPLYWVRNSATRAAAPSEVLRDAGDTGSSTFSERIAAWRTGRERVALDERILQTLSVATRNAVGFLRSVTPQEKPLPVHEHFTAAASFSAFAYDGSKASTMTVALLSPSSSVSWDALRARAGRHARRRVFRGGDGLVARGRAFRRVSCSVRGGDHGSRRRRGGFRVVHGDRRGDDDILHLADHAVSRVRRPQSVQDRLRVVAVAGTRGVFLRARRDEQVEAARVGAPFDE
jgi:hypothetical protein